MKFIQRKLWFILCGIVLVNLPGSLVANVSLSKSETYSISLKGESSQAVFHGAILRDEEIVNSMVLEEENPAFINFSIRIAPNDIGKESEFYFVVEHDRQFYYLDQYKNWQKLLDDKSNLKGYSSKVLEETEMLQISTQELLGKGEYVIYAGYLDAKKRVIHNHTPLGIILFSSQTSGLEKISSENLLHSYFKQSFQATEEDNALVVTEISETEGAGSSMSGAPTSIRVPANFSSTNVQEEGVDEGNLIKTDGQYLYAIDHCMKSFNKTCLFTYQINHNPASNQLLSTYPFVSKTREGNIYLSQIGLETDLKTIITRVASTLRTYGLIGSVGNNNHTVVEILDVSSYQAIQPLSSLQISGALVSSRRIDNQLYLVTRTDPYIEGYKRWYPEEPTEQVTQEQIDANNQLLENFSIYDLMPTIQINETGTKSLHEVDGCYITPYSSDDKLKRSIVSLTLIPLDNPEAYQSTCVIGSTEVFYASGKAIYLSSLRTEQIGEYTETEVPTYKHKTDIHKFLIEDQQLQYRGSGGIPGSLGAYGSQASFRMGEYEGFLGVANYFYTHKGFSKSERTPALHILAENESEQMLEVVGSIDEIGTPKESYVVSSRFFGKYAYIITSEPGNPIYKIDRSDNYAPQIVGQYTGYGLLNFLQPIGEDFLLGIGNHTATETNDSGQTYNVRKGVKISLYDISGADEIKTVQSMEIGYSGTSTGLNSNHLAFAYLAAHNNNPARFVVPINLYDTPPEYSYYEPGDPSYYYDWTHNGLYVFDLYTDENPGFNLKGELITAEAIPYFYYSGEQYGFPVILEDSIHYFQNHQLYSKDIKNL